MLYVARHGRTAANASGLLLGRLDVPLDDEGARQARALGERVASEIAAAGPRRVISSPLLRTRDTARCIGEALGVEVEVDERWIELDYGDLDGTPLVDVPVELWRAWRADPGFVPGGGESLVDLHARVVRAVEDIAAAARDGDVVVVSHVSPIKSAVAWALGVGVETTWRMFLAPASLSRIAVRDAAPSLQSFNETAFLGAP